MTNSRRALLFAVRKRGLKYGSRTLFLALLAMVMLAVVDRNLTLVINVTNLLEPTGDHVEKTEALSIVLQDVSSKQQQQDDIQNIRPECNLGDLVSCPDMRQELGLFIESDGPMTRRRRGLPPRILFHHAHKTGGTSACTMAINNGEVTPPVSIDDLVGNDPVCYYQNIPYCQKDLKDLASINSSVTYVDFHCGARASWRDYIMNENRTHDWMMVTFFRHPLERLLSEYRHYGVDRVFVKNGMNLTKEEKRNNRDLFMKYARDKNRINFYRRFYLPYCSGMDFFQCAEKTLKGYHVLVILEEFQEDCPRFADNLGWRANLTCSTHRNADASRAVDASTYLGVNRSKELLRLNALDVEIYNLARAIANQQRDVWRRKMDKSQLGHGKRAR
jgi:Sulfotransferase family